MDQIEQAYPEEQKRVPTNQSARFSNASGKKSIRPTPKSSKRSQGSQQSLPQSRHSTLNELLEREENNKANINEGRIEDYEEDEEDFICARFPHLDFCACQEQCTIAVVQSNIIELFNNVYISDFVGGLSVKKMLQIGITHVLNVTAMEYKKRTKYFKYQSIDVYDKSDEDIKKHFRITNRFISDALQNGGKVLIQDLDGSNIAPAFALAFLINNEKLPLKNGIEVIKQQNIRVEIKPNFMKQLERYDLEKLALVTLKKKD